MRQDAPLHKSIAGGNTIQKAHSRKPGGHGGGGSVKSYGRVLGKLDQDGGGLLWTATVCWMSREGEDEDPAHSGSPEQAATVLIELAQHAAIGFGATAAVVTT